MLGKAQQKNQERSKVVIFRLWEVKKRKCWLVQAPERTPLPKGLA